MNDAPKGLRALLAQHERGFVVLHADLSPEQRKWVRDDVERAYAAVEQADCGGRVINAAQQLQRLRQALDAIIKEAGPRAGIDDSPGTINTMARIAREALKETA